MTPPFNVLFICSGNSARSIFAEAILNKIGEGRFHAYSAGTRPGSQLNPFAVEVLERNGYDVSGLRSKHLSEFETADAPKMDFVFTVCDSAAAESCPVWPGQPMTAHWGIDDPAAVTGNDMWKRAAFTQAFRYMKNRISVFLALPMESIERSRLTAKVREIAQLEGASVRRLDVA